MTRSIFRLSENRAKSVADFLVAQGVAGDDVTLQGLGSANPIASNDTPEGRAGEPPRRDHSQLRRILTSTSSSRWLWYLLAFVVGSAVAWLITVISIRRTSEEEALADLRASREMGARVMGTRKRCRIDTPLAQLLRGPLLW